MELQPEVTELSAHHVNISPLIANVEDLKINAEGLARRVCIYLVSSKCSFVCTFLSC